MIQRGLACLSYSSPFTPSTAEIFEGTCVVAKNRTAFLFLNHRSLQICFDAADVQYVLILHMMFPTSTIQVLHFYSLKSGIQGLNKLACFLGFF